MKIDKDMLEQALDFAESSAREAGGKVKYLKDKRGVSLVAGNASICGLIRDVLF